MPNYDETASTFEIYRALPNGIPQAIRTGVMSAVAGCGRPRILDLGAGTGRLGRAFAAAGDDYIGVDISFGMLRQFVRMGGPASAVRLVQADWGCLPFAVATFDIVLMAHIFGGIRSWRPLLDEARRVLGRQGAMVLGRTVMPPAGIDEQMKRRLAAELAKLGVDDGQTHPRHDAECWLKTTASQHGATVAGAWETTCTPRRYLERHRTGARFAALPAGMREHALEAVAAWAATTFGSLDRRVVERRVFELQTFTFDGP